MRIFDVKELAEHSWYIAGPMSGIPQFNFPLFDAATAALRSIGLEVVSPAELDNDTARCAALASADGKHDNDKHGGTWGDFLARDVKIVADQVKGVALLPGWQQSRGARLEAYVALLCGHRFVEINTYQEGLAATPAAADYIKKEIFDATN